MTSILPKGIWARITSGRKSQDAERGPITIVVHGLSSTDEAKIAEIVRQQIRLARARNGGTAL